MVAATSPPPCPPGLVGPRFDVKLLALLTAQSGAAANPDALCASAASSTAASGAAVWRDGRNVMIDGCVEVSEERSSTPDIEKVRGKAPF